jgi:hypothetical protein
MFLADVDKKAKKILISPDSGNPFLLSENLNRFQTKEKITA